MWPRVLDNTSFVQYVNSILVFISQDRLLSFWRAWKSGWLVLTFPFSALLFLQVYTELDSLIAPRQKRFHSFLHLPGAVPNFDLRLMATISSPHAFAIPTSASPRPAPPPVVIPLFATTLRRHRPRPLALNEDLPFKPRYCLYPQTNALAHPVPNQQIPMRWLLYRMILAAKSVSDNTSPNWFLFPLLLAPSQLQVWLCTRRWPGITECVLSCKSSIPCSLYI